MEPLARKKSFFTAKKKAIIYTLIFILGLFGVVTYYYSLPRNYNQIFGVTFDQQYARYLGLNWQQVYHKILNDWGFKYARLPVHWDAVEGSVDSFDFTEMDWLMDKSAEYGARVTLVIGQKTLRWPECHLPEWARELDSDIYRARLLDYMRRVVRQYRDHPALEIWQVENEPFLEFGECPGFNGDMLKEEIDMVRELDPNHKILITDSGELSTWQRTARKGDYFGTTLYRVVWNQHLGYVSYNWVPAAFYKFKLWSVGRHAQDSFIVELQGEPWIPDFDIKEYDLEEQMKSMSPDRFEKNVDYAQRVGFSRAYLWGAEWWYWLAAKKGMFYFDIVAKSLNKY